MSGLMAGISLVLAIVYFYLIFHKELRSSAAIDAASCPDPKDAITDQKGFVISSIIFLCAVVMLVTHAQTGLTVAFIGTFIAVVTLITSGKNALTLLKKLDYKTLLFFVGLFVVVGGWGKFDQNLTDNTDTRLLHIFVNRNGIKFADHLPAHLLEGKVIHMLA